jgi:hypothetical protein
MSNGVENYLPIALLVFLRLFILDFALYYRILRDSFPSNLAIHVDFFGNRWYDNNRKTENFVEYWRIRTSSACGGPFVFILTL